MDINPQTALAIGFGIVALIAAHRWLGGFLAVRQFSREYRADIQEVLTSDKSKVKGRFE